MSIDFEVFLAKSLKGKFSMSKQFVTCPRDPKNKYLKKVCEEIFRKNDLRYWCKSCELFQDKKMTGPKNWVYHDTAK